MIINSINSLMANNYRRNSKSNTPQFKGNTGNLNRTVEQSIPQNQKFVSDLKKFSFLKDLFK